jgi:serine/threonine-protein kinase HipA
MRRMERRRAEGTGQAPRALQEIEFLLLVDDEARQGALRFAEQEGGPFLREEGAKRVPALVELPKLLSAAEHVMEDKDTEEDLRLLFAPGSSLGGARPKASIREKDGHLAIAKFPRRDDEYNTVVWEAVALGLAQKSGITVAAGRLEDIGGKPVLLVRRFDRDGARRIPFLSAMNMLGSKDNEQRSYLEIVDALRQHGAAPKVDMEALWRRMVFNILISNTDDHLRNHGFLYEGQAGWRLSPAYDLNPVPTDIKPRILSTAINEEDSTASLPVALDVAEYFELKPDRARAIAAEVGKAVSKWRDEASGHGLKKQEIDRMASAFEHEDLKMAIGFDKK